jgi:hypothetical protein
VSIVKRAKKKMTIIVENQISREALESLAREIIEAESM